MTGPVFTILLLLSVAADAEEQFVKGNDLYLSGAFEAALECYREGLSANCNAGRFHYNSGNSLFRIGRYGEARYHYLAALKYLPRDDRVSHNIGVVSQRLNLEGQAYPGQRRFATAEEISTAALLLLTPASLSFALLCLTRRPCNRCSASTRTALENGDPRGELSNLFRNSVRIRPTTCFWRLLSIARVVSSISS